MDKEKVSELLCEMERKSKIYKKYEELFKSLIELRKQLAILDIIVEDIKLPQRWIIKYPKLIEELNEVGCGDRIMGFNWNLHA